MSTLSSRRQAWKEGNRFKETLFWFVNKERALEHLHVAKTSGLLLHGIADGDETDAHRVVVTFQYIFVIHFLYRFGGGGFSGIYFLYISYIFVVVVNFQYISVIYFLSECDISSRDFSVSRLFSIF